MRHWWVNQKRTFKEEVGGGYMWSPQKKANGHRNRFYENMGIYSSVRSSTDLDAAGQFTEFSYGFQDHMRTGGLKDALVWRDGPYRESDWYKRAAPNLA